MNVCCNQNKLDRWVPQGRRLVLVDIENLVGGSDASAEEVEYHLDRLRVIVPPNDRDVWVVACGSTLLTRAMSTLAPLRPRLGHGADGADRMLVEELDPDRIRGHFASVVLASGDGRAFFQPVRRLNHFGVPTDVVGRSESTAYALRSVARHFFPLSEPPMTIAA